MKSSNKVYVAEQSSYNSDEIREKLRAGIDALGGTEHFLSKGKNVVVKPNLVMRKSPEAAATTHPAVIEAICGIFTEAGAEVTVAESSGGLYNSAVMGLTYRTCGMADACEKSGAKLHTDFGETVLYRDENIKCRAFSIINPIAKADLIIDVCKLKTHTIATMSGACKNMFGAIPGVQKVEMHSRFPDIDDFADMLVDLNLTVTPSLCIMDAIDCMEGNGPTAGTKIHVGALLVSESPFAMDTAAAELSCIDKSILPIARVAKRRKIDTSAELIGADIKALAKAFGLPDTTDTRFEKLSTVFGGRLKKLLSPKPVVNGRICRGCGECVKNCPQKLITVKNGKAHISHNGCIHCFCCHELCRYHAVSIKKSFILKI